ncbi:glycosyltransferase [Haloferax sp. ATB1]|uniref:glycosyltransferase n=1 Tax=Haloferax sp. ATB1 TaxID=1508454 RepID=UPI0018E32B3A|nr:glycosyltransferase [Haloferax sp. ATB1]
MYLDEGAEEGGIAHPTQDLISSLRKKITVSKELIQQPKSSSPRYWYQLAQRSSRETDVVHVHFEYGSFGSLGGIFLGTMFPFFARGLNSPLVMTLHNLETDRTLKFDSLSAVMESIGSLVRRPMEMSMRNSTDFFITLMQEQADYLAETGVDPSHIEHIPLVPETDPTLLDKDKCKRNLGIEGKHVITSFGWVRRSKGYERIIKFLDQLPDDVVFLVAGGARTNEHEAYVTELKQLVEDRGLSNRVIFTGYLPREDHPTVLNATDVLVLPYRDNRASDALARGLSYRIPVVTSSNREFSSIRQKWGCILTASDNDELREQVSLALFDEETRRSLQRNATSYAESMNWDAISEEIIHKYQLVVTNE